MNKNTKFPRQEDRKRGNKKAHDKKTEGTAPKRENMEIRRISFVRQREHTKRQGARAS